MSSRKFSIILPVRNGMPHIIDAVGSVLNQTYTNFVLHILDNQSTDGTLEWCKSIDDVRVRVSASESPLSIEDSWGRIVKTDKCEFLTMFAHDDILLPEFLENVDSLIDQYPDANLYQVNGEFIDNKGSVIRQFQPTNRIETVYDYLQARFSGVRDVFGTGYVMRSEAYNRVGGIPKFNKLSFADDALWLMLIDDGYKAYCEFKSIQVRIHEKSTSATSPDNWRGFLIAIKQFADFLASIEESDPSLAANLADLKKRFFKKYLVNIYILGLVYHAEREVDFSDKDLSLLMDACQLLLDSNFTSLNYSPKVALILFITKIHRPLLPWLWRMYQAIRAS